jgi:hypothetical protein
LVQRHAHSSHKTAKQDGRSAAISTDVAAELDYDEEYQA